MRSRVAPQNNKMQRTSPGQDGGSPLILVFYVRSVVRQPVSRPTVPFRRPPGSTRYRHALLVSGAGKAATDEVHQLEELGDGDEGIE